MQIDLAMTPSELSEVDLGDKIAVIIDVFRFTTTCLAALENGAAGVYMASSIPEAVQLAKDLSGEILLAGEREAARIPDFHLGNSPLEFTRQAVAERLVVSTTTNGTRAVRAASGAAVMMLACLRNAAATVEVLAGSEREVVFVPAGLRGRLSLEDTWCAGWMIARLQQEVSGQLTDSARTAAILAHNVAVDDLADSEHGRFLQNLGLMQDLEYCLSLNTSRGVVQIDPERGGARLMHISSQNEKYRKME